MQKLSMGLWELIILEVVIIILAGAVGYLVAPAVQVSMPTTTITTTTSSTSVSSSTTVTTTIDYSKPYLTSTDMERILGPIYGTGSYTEDKCDPTNNSNSNYCKNIAFFSTIGNFSGYIIQYKSEGISLNEILFVQDPNSKEEYTALIQSIYPNSTTGYYPSSLILNATENGTLYSVQFGDSYTNVYVLEGNNAAAVYLSGENYSSSYTDPIINTVIKDLQGH